LNKLCKLKNSEMENGSDQEMDDMIEQALQTDEEGDGEHFDEDEHDDNDSISQNTDEDDCEPLNDEDENDEAPIENDNDNEVWEDIYGRSRSKDGTILDDKKVDETLDNIEVKKDGTYIPPAKRKMMKLGQTEQKKAELARLAKQLKGQLNRLAESNMMGIARFVEDTYRQHARNDVNETLTELLSSGLVCPTLTPFRLVMEHVMLVAILHANIGTEVGAHILQSMVRKFSTCYEDTNLSSEESKILDNILLILSYIYSFKIVDAKLIFAR